MKFLFVVPFVWVCTASHLGAEELHLSDPGLEKIVDYNRYGIFTATGTSDYRFYMKDREGLANAVGEGIYPNVAGLQRDPIYRNLKSKKKLEENGWDYLNSGRWQEAFYKWASNPDQPLGLKQFYTALILENAGLYTQAIKAYQATVVHFPTAYAHTSWGTPWYVGPAALDSVVWLIRHHPELHMRLEGGRVRIQNRYEDNPRDEVFEVDPGQILPDPRPEESFHAVLNQTQGRLDSLSIRRQLGRGKVHLTQYSNGHWQLFVDKAPFVVRGISYVISPVGRSPDNGTLVVHRDWMIADENKNGKIDGPYDSWVDKNRNNRQDPEEPAVGDFRLMKKMGVNTLRLYHHEYNKNLLRDLFKTFGIRVMMGDLLGAYTVGSEAEWTVGTDYRDPAQRQKMLASVRAMVEQEKEEPYILCWVLGNENNYGNANNARKFPHAYYGLVNEAAQLIKSLDSQHPVVLANGDLTFIKEAAELCPQVDVFGANVYRGRHGMGDTFWKDAAEIWGKPVLITEFGCPAFHRYKSEAVADALQAEWLKNNWEDIAWNLGGGPGVGNSLGGVLYEWMDEWWKSGPPPKYDPAVHHTVGQFQGPFPDGWSYEEWYGIVSQGDGRHSPFIRQLRPAYDMFIQEWKQPKKGEKQR